MHDLPGEAWCGVSDWPTVLSLASAWPTDVNAQLIEAPIGNWQPYSPEWWVRFLSARLATRQVSVRVYDDYYEGRHRLGYAGVKWQQTFGSLFSHFADNWCQLVVDACAERLRVEGFRMTDDPEGDADAWDIWQRNGLDNDSGLVHTDALVAGSAYAIVWPDNAGQPTVSVESAAQVIVAYAAESRRTRTAALKQWLDDSGQIMAT